MGISILFRERRQPKFRAEIVGNVPDSTIESACRVYHNTRGEEGEKRFAMREFLKRYGANVRFHVPKSA